MRSPCVAAGPEAGTAPSGSGGRAKPFRDATSASRRAQASTCARDGATPETPMNGAPGMRTPGSCGDVAQPSAMVQWMRKGVVMTSRRKPRPGMMAVKAHRWGAMSRNSTSSRSPAGRP